MSASKTLFERGMGMTRDVQLPKQDRELIAERFISQVYMERNRLARGIKDSPKRRK